MLTPDYLAHVADDVVVMYQALEDALIRDMVRRLLNTNFEITQSAVWQMEKLQQAGVLYDNAVKQIASVLRKSDGEIKKLFEEGATESLRFDDAVYRKAGLNPLPIKQSPGMLQILMSSIQKSNGELKNLTRTTAISAKTSFIQIVDLAYMKVSSGAFDYNSAIRQAIQQAANQGLKVLYPSGRSSNLDVAVRRNVLTGVSQTCGLLQIQRMEEMGCDLVETTAHADARPDHMTWQGKVFSRSGSSKEYPPFEESTGYGTITGLMGVNCRHNFFPFFEGISKRAYTEKELKDLKERATTYNDVGYTDYEASQIQRRMEREIRATKRELIGYDSAVKFAQKDPDKNLYQAEYNAAAAKLKGQEAKLGDFLKQTGRAEDRARVQTYGFGKSISQKTVQTFNSQLLPNYVKAVIPDSKLIDYALNVNHEKGKNKAIAFEKYLGYNVNNKDMLINEVRQGLSKAIAKARKQTKYGTPFGVGMRIRGANGKYANIKTGWIIDKGNDIPRLTSIYVDE